MLDPGRQAKITKTSQRNSSSPISVTPAHISCYHWHLSRPLRARYRSNREYLIMACLICFQCRRRIDQEELTSGVHLHAGAASMPMPEPAPPWRTYLLKAAQPCGGGQPSESV